MVKELVAAHGRAVLVTFEIFWVLIFILDRVGGQSSAAGIPQFIYVNF